MLNNLFAVYKRRPLLHPFLLVLSNGIGVTSSILPIFIQERAKARRAECAPGPMSTYSSQFNVKTIYAEGFTFFYCILCSQHDDVLWGFISVCFNDHTTSDTSNGFLSRQISNVYKSVIETDKYYVCYSKDIFSLLYLWSWYNLLFLLSPPLSGCHLYYYREVL